MSSASSTRDASSAADSGEPTSGSSQIQPHGFEVLKQRILENKVMFALFCSRVLQVVFALFCFFPIISSPEVCYTKSLVCCVATSALRLHQRVPQLQLSRQCLASLLGEDAGHYLIFGLLFLFGSSSVISMALLPVTLFSVLHAASYSLRLVSWYGGEASVSGGSQIVRLLVSVVESQSQNILRAAAISEIFLMPYTVFMVLSGRCSLLVPFMLYRFVGLRYVSRRNPYCRTAFHQLRQAVEQLAARGSCPRMLAALLLRAVAMLCALCPQTAP